MSLTTGPAADEMSQAEVLPQLDASSLVDRERLEAEVKAMYRHVARGEEAELHFEVGRGLAEHLGYPGRLLDAIPAEALASFAGVGHHLDLAALQPGEAVLDLGSGSGTDVFCAAVLVGETGRVVGVDITDEQLDKAARLRDREGFSQVQFVEAHIEELPFDDASFDAVLSNGVINLSPAKGRVFAEAARVLRPGGRLAIADIVSGRALKERTRRNVELWAACIAGAIPRSNYLEAIEAQGLQVKELRKNDYRFISERALDACSTYEVESISLVATIHATHHTHRGGLEVSVVTDTFRNGVDTEKMFATLDLIKAQPELAKFQFRATNRWIDGSHNRSTIKDFYAAGGEDTTRSEAFVIDAGEPAILLGSDTGANPAEYLLHALAACLTTSIVYVAAARKVQLTSVESTLTGDMDVRGALGVDDEPRNGFERIGVAFHVTGDAPQEKLREIVERARKRSAVYDMVTNGVPVAVEVTTD